MTTLARMLPNPGSRHLTTTLPAFPRVTHNRVHHFTDQTESDLSFGYVFYGAAFAVPLCS